MLHCLKNVKTSILKEIIIPVNKAVYQTLLILSPIILFIAGRSFYNNWSGANPPLWWLGILALIIALSIYFFINSIRKVMANTTAVKINRQGVEDRISMAKPGLIPWENIKGAEIRKYTGSDHLLIYLKDPEPVIAPLNFFQTKMAQQMVEDVNTPIAINPKLIRYDVKKLRDLINKKVGFKPKA